MFVIIFIGEALTCAQVVERRPMTFDRYLEPYIPFVHPKQFREFLTDESHLRRVREMSCAICHSPESDPDHLQLKSQGRNDYSCIPLCRKHHRERHDLGNQQFQEKYRIDLQSALIATLILCMKS